MTDVPVVAVVLAAGRGTRFGADDPPKQLAPLAGLPVMAHALRTVAAAGVHRVVVTAPAEAVGALDRVCAEHLAATPFRVVEGGENRNASVARAVAAIDLVDAQLLVHPGVRPLVSVALVRHGGARPTGWSGAPCWRDRRRCSCGTGRVPRSRRTSP